MKIKKIECVKIISECWTVAEKKFFMQRVSGKCSNNIHTLLPKAYATKCTSIDEMANFLRIIIILGLFLKIIYLHANQILVFMYAQTEA